ncbi:Lipase maturation factor 2 [Echinococcus granulosus]|uniref:Lipase maturation factor n=1 Tax=Echinococcus granulosus TaxID=6210 RepID=U6J1P9_ECHGR|nr:Lipase maturation factor [Echinococcus granulosus]EUB64405.1 Lipase maturation factor [Echinococcus granulosus]KAH9283123.1 Lipase maturation factor 2 [Echinococcus granulosus]CDS17221.1 lipase maturation factor [Echinococcus granulosus]
MFENAVLFGINLVYFLAFASLYVQLPGLIGDEGVAPVRLLDLSVPKTLEDFLMGIPSIIRFHNSFYLSEYHAAELSVLAGLTLSFLSMAIPQLLGTLSLLFQWISFFSIVKVCPGVADWKWTSLLIEAGFLCFLLSIKLRKYSRSASMIVAWLIKWLLFREAVSTGFARLANDNYFWWDLSAMEHYFSTQISPTPAAYYLSLAPSLVLRIISLFFIVMEIFIPFLFLIPVRELQIFSFFAKVMFHADLIVIGNHGIYNLLSIVLSFALLPEPKRCKGSPVSHRFVSVATTVAVLTVLFYGVWVFFGFQEGIEAMRITILRKEFIDQAKTVNYYTVLIVSSFFALNLLAEMFRSLSTRGCMNRMLDFTGVALVGLMGGGLFAASLAPFSSLVDSSSVVPLPSFAHELTAALKPFHLANDYRFFHQKEKDVLLKVDRQRTVLVLEGAMNENGPWKELSFHHVPSTPEKMPSIIPGHLPVVDFEAALSGERTFENSPIVATLVYRILTKEKEVLALLELSGFPIGPKFVQIRKYTYEISRPLNGPRWWKRKLQNIYLPPTQASTPRLTQLMTKIGIVGKRRGRPLDANLVSSLLDKLRAMVGQPANLNGFYVVLVVAFLVNKIF